MVGDIQLIKDGELKAYILSSHEWIVDPEIYKGTRKMYAPLYNGTFWDLWRSSKDEIKRAGFWVSKKNGSWRLYYRRN
jgi:hypothetical protein